MRKIYRLQAIGGSYYIAVPKEWLKRLNLDKGSHVEVSLEPDGSLRIRPIEMVVKEDSERTLCEVGVEVKEKDHIYTLLVSLYLEGYDTIVLHFKDSSIGSAIRGAVNKAKNILLGFEIVDEDSFSMTLRVLSSSDTDVHAIIKNMNRIARSMYLDTLIALIERDVEKAYEVEARDQDLNRLYFYVTRVIRKKVVSHIEPKETLKLVDLRMIAKAIEEIGDDAKRAAKIVQEIVLGDVDVDTASLEKLKTYVNELDAIYRNIMNRIEKSSPLSELVDALYNCEKIRWELSSFRRNIVSTNIKGVTHLSEIVYAYENISTHIYDIISLAPAMI